MVVLNTLGTRHRRTIYDEKNDREIVLTKQDLEIIRKIKAGKSPSASYDPYPVRPPPSSFPPACANHSRVRVCRVSCVCGMCSGAV